MRHLSVDQVNEIIRAAEVVDERRKRLHRDNPPARDTTTLFPPGWEKDDPLHKTRAWKALWRLVNLLTDEQKDELITVYILGRDRLTRDDFGWVKRQWTYEHFGLWWKVRIAEYLRRGLEIMRWEADAA
jgi:hypothetical protein